MLWSIGDHAPLIADIHATAPDVLTLQEVTDNNRALLDGVRDILPTQFWCRFQTVGGVALASRWPLIEGTETCGVGLAAVQLETPHGPLWLVSVHYYWPWPHGQAHQVERLLPVLETLQGRVVIGGDFNMVPWGSSVGRLAHATNTERIGRALISFARLGPLLPLPIDQVHAPRGATGAVTLRPLLGSDHHGLLARIGL
nr:endonuclease/exonuclease/phosphatase family protein [Pseudoruegeria sp. HB172150]